MIALLVVSYLPWYKLLLNLRGNLYFPWVILLLDLDFLIFPVTDASFWIDLERERLSNLVIPVGLLDLNVEFEDLEYIIQKQKENDDMMV